MNAGHQLDAAGASLDETRVKFVMRKVADYISREGLHVGDALPSEIRLSQTLGVSRTAIREAFGGLSALNMIDTASGRRPRVHSSLSEPMSATLQHAVSTEQISIIQVWETRRCIETETAAMAASRRNEDEALEICKLATAMARAKPGSPELMRHDLDLHKAIAKASRNILMANIIASFEPMLEVAIPSAWRIRKAEDHDRTLEHHLAIARAVLNRDPVAARQAMTAHFDQSIGAMFEAMSQE